MVCALLELLVNLMLTVRLLQLQGLVWNASMVTLLKLKSASKSVYCASQPTYSLGTVFHAIQATCFPVGSVNLLVPENKATLTANNLQTIAKRSAKYVMRASLWKMVYVHNTTCTVWQAIKTQAYANPVTMGTPSIKEIVLSLRKLLAQMPIHTVFP